MLHVTDRRFWSGMIVAAALAAPLVAQEFPKMDDTWTVMVNGQIVQVESDGSFTIPNVSAADQFGPGGPGTAPDFVSDDFLRVIGISTAGGVTRYAYSDPFQFKLGQEFSVGQMTLSDDPPPFPQSIVATPDDVVLTAVGQQTVVTVIGTLIDGSLLDVTSASAGTTYFVSNSAVLTVDQDGLATAVSEGTAFVTALNEGAASVAQVVVSLDDPLTTVVGFVVDEDGANVAGATVTLVGQGQSSTTQANGDYSIPGVATKLGQVRVQASLGNLKGTSDPVDPVPDMLTDAGVITVVPVQDVLVFGDRPGERATLTADLISLGRVVTNVQNLPADLTSFGTIWHVGAFVPLTAAEQAQLDTFVAGGGGIHLTGERPCCETMNASLQTFLNGLVTGGGIAVGGQGDIPGPYPFNPGAAAAITTNPNPLTTWNPSAPGGVGGLGSLPDPNILVTGSGSRPVGGIWDCADLVGGQGHVTILMDVNWFTNSNRLPVIENIQTFLELGTCSP